MKLLFALSAAAMLSASCGGGGDGVSVDPIDRYVGKWQRCDTLGPADQSRKVSTVWTIAKSNATTGQLVVHESTTSACDQPGEPARQIATGRVELTGLQQQGQGEAWDRVVVQVERVGDDCSPSPSVCSAFPALMGQVGNTLRTSVAPILVRTRVPRGLPGAGARTAIRWRSR